MREALTGTRHTMRLRSTVMDRFVTRREAGPVQQNGDV